MKKALQTRPGRNALYIFMIFSLHFRLSATVEYDDQIPQLAFAAREIENAIEESGKRELIVELIIKNDSDAPEAFQIRTFGTSRVEVTGSDASGAMYGGLEIADHLKLGLPIRDMDQAPYLEKRGVKINIPLDSRIPAFADGGESPRRNIITMWDFTFWKEYLDDLARYRYNVVSLWAAHPFPSMIKLEDYPEVAMDDIHYFAESENKPYREFRLGDKDAPGLEKRIKKMPIEDKIKFWKKVFQYAEDRGIEIIMVHWNVFTYGATGKYGITPDQDNRNTVAYLRKCVREMLLTYPQIKGIGTCAGELDDRYMSGEFKTENFVYNSYAKAVMDVKKLQPEREIRFIIRRHSTEYEDIIEAFQDYTGGVMETSVKYAVAHMYSSRRPQEWEKRIVDEGWLEKYNAWLNLRNDDIFMHRWGSPDFVRDLINWIPIEHVPGFYMGSDTYVWGREFISKNPETAGQLEIEKHWYQFRLWGQLAYNNELGDDYWKAALQHRFPGIDAGLLFDAWETVSEVVPQVNRSVWSPTDGSFGVEGSRRTSGYLTVYGYQFDRPAMVLNLIDNAPDPQCISVTDWAKAELSGGKLEGITPLEVAENLDGYAAVALEALPALRAQAGGNVELMETLNDIESMAYLGRYYADKMRAAAQLALFRESGRKDKKMVDRSAAHMENAVEEWKAYAEVLSRQYRPQYGSRANDMDWNGTVRLVEKEVEMIREEKDYPELRFVNLKDGARIKEGSDLRVELEATDGNGPPDVTLRLNGQVLHGEKSRGNRYVYTGSGDSLLKSLQSGMYHLEATALDHSGLTGEWKDMIHLVGENGLRTSREINIRVGDADPLTADDWKDQIHAVVFNEGEMIWDGEKRAFPRLECALSLEEDGTLRLIGGNFNTPGKADRPKWDTKDNPNPFRFYAIFEGGQLQVYRERCGRPIVKIYETPRVSGAGPFKLGITASKRLVVFQGEGDLKTIAWKSN